MNPLHYPTFDRCAKLRELGFPMTEKICRIAPKDDCIYPSVMELLDVLPKIPNYDLECTQIYEELKSCVLYRNDDDDSYLGNKYFEGTLPNCLCDLIFMLVENGHLKFPLQ